jgi:hypothetical protein
VEAAMRMIEDTARSMGVRVIDCIDGRAQAREHRVAYSFENPR